MVAGGRSRMSRVRLCLWELLSAQPCQLQSARRCAASLTSARHATRYVRELRRRVRMHGKLGTRCSAGGDGRGEVAGTQKLPHFKEHSSKLTATPKRQPQGSTPYKPALAAPTCLGRFAMVRRDVQLWSQAGASSYFWPVWPKLSLLSSHTSSSPDNSSIQHLYCSSHDTPSLLPTILFKSQLVPDVALHMPFSTFTCDMQRSARAP